MPHLKPKKGIRYFMRAILYLMISILFVSCASVEKSTTLGAVVGGIAGGLIANSTANKNQRNQSTLTGAVIGAGIGALAGYSAFKEKQKKEREATLQQNPMESKTPSLTAPKVRRVWVPAKIEGQTYVDGHYIYVIEKTSGWSD